MEWSKDGKYLFFGQEDDVSKRSDKIWRHVVGTDNNDFVYEEKDVLFNVSVGRSRDKKMLFIGSYAKTMGEYRYLAADDPTGEWKVISPAAKAMNTRPISTAANSISRRTKTPRISR